MWICWIFRWESFETVYPITVETLVLFQKSCVDIRIQSEELLCVCYVFIYYITAKHAFSDNNIIICFAFVNSIYRIVVSD